MFLLYLFVAVICLVCGSVPFCVLSTVVNRCNPSSSCESLRSQLGTRCESLDKRLVDIGHETWIQEFVHGVLLTGFLEHGDVVVYVGHCVSGNGTRGGSRRGSDSGEARVTASQQTVDGCLQVGEGEWKELA